MFKDLVKNYFSFTKKERNAVMVLMLLILVVAILPDLLPERNDPADKAALEQFQQEIVALRPLSKDSFHAGRYENRPSGSMHYAPENEHKITTRLFYFDPNTLPEDGWMKLGLSQKTAGTIIHYLEKGGKFRKPEDIGKIYSLKKNDLERLLPFVRLHEPDKEDDHRTIQKENYKSQPYTRTFKPMYTDLIIDINHTDTTTLQLLPGIGSKFAARILSFKDKLGGFYAVDQVAETYGLPDSTFQKIKSHLMVSDRRVAVININTSDANQLKQHPYFRWNIANAIIQYRTQHGNFKNKEDLLQIAAITPELYKKLIPYISIE